MQVAHFHGEPGNTAPLLGLRIVVLSGEHCLQFEVDLSLGTDVDDGVHECVVPEIRCDGRCKSAVTAVFEGSLVVVPILNDTELHRQLGGVGVGAVYTGDEGNNIGGLMEEQLGPGAVIHGGLILLTTEEADHVQVMSELALIRSFLAASRIIELLLSFFHCVGIRHGDFFAATRWLTVLGLLGILVGQLNGHRGNWRRQVKSSHLRHNGTHGFDVLLIALCLLLDYERGLTNEELVIADTFHLACELPYVCHQLAHLRFLL